jgi:oligosaccharide repeat unit polymerase
MFCALSGDTSYLTETIGAFGGYNFNYPTITTTTLCIINSYFAIQIGLIIKKFKTNTEVLNVSNIKRLDKISIILFLIGGLGFIINLYLKLLSVYRYGYLYLFTGQVENDIQENIIIKVSGVIFHIGYAILFCSSEKGKKLKTYTLIYVILLLLNLLSGQRGESFSILITILIIYFARFNYQISIKSILILGVCFLILLVGIDIFRDSRQILSLFEIIEIFFGQSKSYIIINNSIVYESQINYKLINLFSEIRSWLYSIQGRLLGVTVDATQNQYASMKEFGHLGQTLSYLTNEGSFMIGKGIGSSYIAELYLLGKQKVILIHGLIFGIILSYFSTYKNKIFNNVLAIVMIPSILFMPRDSTLSILSNNIIAISIIFIIYYAYRIRWISKKL